MSVQRLIAFVAERNEIVFQILPRPGCESAGRRNRSPRRLFLWVRCFPVRGRHLHLHRNLGCLSSLRGDDAEIFVEASNACGCGTLRARASGRDTTRSRRHDFHVAISWIMSFYLLFGGGAARLFRSGRRCPLDQVQVSIR